MPDAPRSNKLANSTDVEVGRRLRMQRKILGLSQSDLGDALGITFQQIQKYEKGTNRIGASRLLQIAKLVKVEVSYFFDGQEPKPQGDEPPNEVIAFLESPDGLAVNRAFLKIGDPSTRKKVIGLIKAISQSVG